MKRFLQITLLLCSLLFPTVEVSAWEFKLLSPTSGSKVESLYQIHVEITKTFMFLDDWPVPTVTMTSSTGRTITMSFDDMNNRFQSEDPITEAGTYTLNIPENHYHISGEGNEAAEFTWTIGDGDQGGNSGNTDSGDSTPEPWEIPSSITPNEGNIASLSSFSFTLPDEKNGYTATKSKFTITDNSTNYNISNITINEKTVSGTISPEITNAGTYTLTIQEGAIKANDNSVNTEKTFIWAIPQPWSIGEITPTEVPDNNTIYEFSFTLPQGKSNFEIDKNKFSITGTTISEISINGNTVIGRLQNPITANGTYTLTIQHGAIVAGDKSSNTETTKSWTIGWKFTQATPTIGSEVSQLQSIEFKYPSGVKYMNRVVRDGGEIICPNGTIKPATLSDNFPNGVTVSFGSDPITDIGVYTLIIYAGSLIDSNGNPNAKMTYTWEIVPQPWAITSSITPNEGNITSPLSSFSFTLPESKNDYSISDNDLITLDSNEENYTISNLVINDKTVYGTLSSTIKKPGTYYLTISKDAIIAGDGSTNIAKTYTWTIPQPASWDITDLTPTEVPDNNTISEFSFTLPQGKSNFTIDENKFSITNYSGAINIAREGNTVTGTLDPFITEAGSYTLKIQKGAITADDYSENNQLRHIWTIGEPTTPDPGEDGGNTGEETQTGWKFTGVSPAKDEVTSLGNIQLLASGNITEWGPIALMVKKDGNNLKEWKFIKDLSNYKLFTGNANDYQSVSAPGTYTLTIPAGTFHINGEGNAAQTFTWTIKESEAEPWEFTSVVPANESTVKSLKNIQFTMPEGTTMQGGEYVDMTGPNGTTQVNITNASITLSTTQYEPGDYTIIIPAGKLKDNNNVGNKEMTYTWTISAPEYTAIDGGIKFVAENKNGKWATYSNEKVTFISSTVKICTIIKKNSGDGIKLNYINKIVEENINQETHSGTFIPANTGVLLQIDNNYSNLSNAEVWTVEGKELDQNYVKKYSDNLLQPSSKNMGEQDLNNHKFYRLAYKDFNAKTGLGFYYGAGKTNGEAFVCKEGTAYLAVPNYVGARSFYMFDEDDETTGVNNVNENENENANGTVYNLAGQRVNANHKGIVIVNGKKVVK